MPNQQADRLARRPSRQHARTLLVAAVVLMSVAGPASAVVLVDSAARNTAAPTGPALAAWNLQGTLGSFLATPIAPNLFIAAKHIGGGGAGLTMTLGGQDYTTTRSFDLPNSDLRIYEIQTNNGTRTFGQYAKLYDASQSGSEVGKPLFVAGRGTQRGEAYIANGTQRGWLWGTEDRVRSWGTSNVSGIAFDDDLGEFLTFNFTNPGGIALTSGDSSGGLFVLQDGEYQLAGLNYGTDSGWSETEAGPYVNASVYDARNLFLGRPDAFQQVPDAANPLAGQSYASRISSNRAAIDDVFAQTGNAALVPEPTTVVTALLLTAALCPRRRRRP